MPELTGRLLRVLKKPPTYVLERAYNELRMRTERYRLPRRSRRATAIYLANGHGYSSVDEWWSALSRRAYPAALDISKSEYEKMCPGDFDRIIESADRACRHQVDLLGSGPIDLGQVIDWQKDYKTGYRWPHAYCGDLEYGKREQRSDVKFPWELSRLQWLIPAGQAYVLTGDERYAGNVRDVIDSWIRDNPCGGSINWSCTMEAAMRVVTLTWFFHVFKNSAQWTDRGFRERFLRALYLHGDFTARHLEKSDINGNHYTADAAGLVVAGLFFGEAMDARRWSALGWDILCAEIVKQVYGDGVDFEGSVAYHRLVQELFLLPAIYRLRIGLDVPDFYRERLLGMARFTAAYSRADGSSPLVGDADDARVLPFGGQSINDHRYLPAVVGSVFGGEEVVGQFSGSRAEIVWLLGVGTAKSAERSTRTTATPSSARFDHAGYFVLRNGSDHLFVNCSRLGLGGRGGHSHNDSLSLEAMLAGVHLIADCGAYVYTSNYEERNNFRSTAYHNTPQVDGEEINRLVSENYLWMLHNDAKPDVRQITFSEREDRVVVAHTGYKRLPDPVTPVRTVILEHASHHLIINDALEGSGEHRVEIPLHLALGVEARQQGNTAILVKDNRTFLLRWDATDDWSFRIGAGRVSPSYGVVLPITRLSWSRSGPLRPLKVEIVPQ